MSLTALIEKIKETRETSFVEAEEYFSNLEMSVGEHADRIFMRANHTFKIDLEANDIMDLMQACEAMYEALQVEYPNLHESPLGKELDSICAEVQP